MNEFNKVEIFFDRCLELTNKNTAPALLEPLASPKLLGAFLYESVLGSSAFQEKIRKKSSAIVDWFKNNGIETSTDLWSLSEENISDLRALPHGHSLCYWKSYFNRCEEAFRLKELELTVEGIAKLAHCLVTRLLSLGFMQDRLFEYFSDPVQRECFFYLNLQEAVSTIRNFFESQEPREFTIYSPSVIGAGAESRGFRRVAWANVPSAIQEAFKRHLAQSLNIVPEEEERVHDDGYPARYCKYQKDLEILKQSKFIRGIETALDHYSAAEQFFESFREMKNIVYVSKQAVGGGGNKSPHYTKRNTGGSPAQIQEVLAINEYDTGSLDEVRVVNPQAPTFTYQKMTNEIPRQRWLLKLFCSRCEIFQVLTTAYGEALEAYARNDSEDIFRHLAIALEISFQPTQKHNVLIDVGSRLLALDWLRGQFQSLTFLTKKYSPSRSEKVNPIQTHLCILKDRFWPDYAESTKASELFKWRREELIKTANSPKKIEGLRIRYSEELKVLWKARHQYAHGAKIFRDSYFVGLLLNFLRVVLDFRFSTYAVWTEWHAKTVLRNDYTDKDIYEKGFVEGWLDEFALRREAVEEDFKKIKEGSITNLQGLVLGAGYVGLGVHPKRNTPACPLTYCHSQSNLGNVRDIRGGEYRV